MKPGGTWPQRSKPAACRPIQRNAEASRGPVTVGPLDYSSRLTNRTGRLSDFSGEVIAGGLWRFNPRRHTRVHRRLRRGPGGSLSTKPWIARTETPLQLRNNPPPRSRRQPEQLLRWGEPVPVSDAPGAVHRRGDSPIRSLLALPLTENPPEPPLAVHHARLS